MGDTIGRIREFVATDIMLESDASKVGNDTVLVGGVLDSLGLMQLVSFIQEEFGFTFEESEVTPENFQSVASVERLVEEKLRSVTA